MEQSDLLLNIAAEGIASIIPGCAQAITAKDANQGLARDAGPLNALTYFAPKIVERWLVTLSTLSPLEQQDTLAGVAALPAADSKRAAQTAIDLVAAGASADDKLLATEYLAAIPLMARRLLVRDPETNRLSLPPNVSAQDVGTLMQCMPPDVPPFPVGSDLANTPYYLEELLGIGGFGAVYKARNRFEQHQPPRAIKFCLDPSMVASLARERTILDRLMQVDVKKWSNRIVRLYGYALEAKPPFLVYEYVSGGDLANYIRVTKQKTGRGLNPAEVLDLIRQATEALAFAHQQGLVHRDLKPANVLMSGSKIKLTDFGIGGVVSSAVVRGTTMGGSILGALSGHGQTFMVSGSGTPLYMSPEQRRGDQPDPRHDLFSLGVMWYQLLVGDVSRELHPGWPDELIEEFQVPQEQIELIQRCVGYFKKRPANGEELLKLLSGAAGKQAPVSAEPSAAIPDAKKHRDPEFDQLKDLLATQIEHDQLIEARETVTAILRLKPDDPEAHEVQAFLDEKLTTPLNELHVFGDHQAWVRSVAISPDGRRALSASDDRTIIVWDLDSRAVVRRLTGHKAAVMSIAYGPDGKRAVSGSWDGTARLWNLETGEEIRTFSGVWKSVKSAAIARDGVHIMISGVDGKLYVCNVGNGAVLHCLEGHAEQIQSIDVAPNGPFAVTGGNDGKVFVWDVKNGRELRRLEGHTDSVTSVAFAPNGRWVLSGSTDHTARLWDLQSGKELRRLSGHKNWINSVAFSPTEMRILTASGGAMVDDRFEHGEDKSVRVWDVRSEREQFRYAKHTATVSCAAFAPSGRMILSGGLDNTVRLLMLPTSS